MAFISVAISLSLTKIYADKHGYEIDANQVKFDFKICHDLLTARFFFYLETLCVSWFCLKLFIFNSLSVLQALQLNFCFVFCSM